VEAFSVERLMRFLVALGQDVEIVVKPLRKTSREPATALRGLIPADASYAIMIGALLGNRCDRCVQKLDAGALATKFWQ
jgi:hypothetical protein